MVGSQLFVLSHKATSGVSVEWWRDELAAEDAEHGWKTGTDWVPHDAKHREFGTGRTIIETMRALNLKPMPVPSVPVQDGINAVRRTLPFCVFHPRCEEGGLSALEQYRREWDDEKKAFRASAVHDWTSHPADAFRYLALSWRAAKARVIEPPKRTGIVIPPPHETAEGCGYEQWFAFIDAHARPARRNHARRSRTPAPNGADGNPRSTAAVDSMRRDVSSRWPIVDALSISS